jgi:hypothetical protein
VSDAVSANLEPAKKLGFANEDLIQELGYDDDVDYDLRDSIEDLIGSELLTEETMTLSTQSFSGGATAMEI